MTELRTTHRLTVTEDMIDHLGHMNVRYYGEAALTATDGLVEELGGDVDVRVADLYTRHLREQLLGADLEVRSLVLGGGAGTLRLYHELRNADTDVLAASFVHRIEGRRGDEPADAWPPGVEGERVIPEAGRPRTIALDADPIASAPTLEEVLADPDLALRRPRSIEAGECRADGTFDPGWAPMLVWGGEPLEGTDGPVLYEGEDGAIVGWATMEHRSALRRLPRVGDRIQSFGATATIFDKNTHRVMWAYDLDRGDLLAAIEVVDLAFDTRTRTAVPIPAERRRHVEQRLRPRYAPR